MKVLAVALLTSAFAVSAHGQNAAPAAAEPEAHQSPNPAGKLVYVRMSTSMGDIVLELNREKAPITVENFLAYTRGGAYDGTTFHRVVKDFVIQGGGWEPELKERAKAAAAAGKPDKPIKNEWQNGLKNERGTIAMAREAEPDSATREFYINVKDNPKLDTARETTGKTGYAVFGRVVAGMDVVDRIRAVPTKKIDVPGVTDGSMENVPAEPVVIRSVRVIPAGEGKAAAEGKGTDTKPAGKSPEKEKGGSK